MAYPKKLLADDEQIVYELRPHWRALVAPAFVFLVTLGVGFFLLAKFDNAAVRWIVAGVMVIALVVWVVRPFVYWYSTQYVFTDHRIIVRTGIIARKGRDMPLSRVNDVSFSHSFIERFLNCGTLQVESAGTQGQLVITSVPNVEQIQRDIYRLHDEDDMRRRQQYEQRPGPPPPVPGPSSE
ncbi:MAG: PH domain-containing protein [Frankiales bacterium]|nr:PH domain-containing protein [Frankiales bacterium]